MITKFYISDPERGIIEEHSIEEMELEELHNLVYYAYPTWCRIVKVEEVDYTLEAMHEELHNQLLNVYYLNGHKEIFDEGEEDWRKSVIKTKCKICKEETQ